MLTPLPSMDEEGLEEVRSYSEKMPGFLGHGSGSKAEKKKCRDKKLLQYLAKNLKYPIVAKENGTGGKLIVKFLVIADGSV